MEQSYPLKPYVNTHSSDTSCNLPSESRRLPDLDPSFTIQRKPLPRGHERTSSGYTPLIETHVHNHITTPQREQRWVSVQTPIKWWLPEIIACLLAIACLIAIIIVLRNYDGRLLDNANLPHSLTLNGIIAALSTLARVALMVPVASSLSQEAWIWFSLDARHNRQHQSRLKDLDLSNSASRGAWGSLMFLVLTRRRWIAYVGAVATILSLAFGTFTQQLLAIGQFPLAGNSDSAPGNLPRAENWQYWSAVPGILPLHFRAAIYNGMLTDRFEPIAATCATGNCTWPITPSLAVCGACSPTSYIQRCDVNVCNYTMPSGVKTQLTNLPSGGMWFSVRPSGRGGIYKESTADRAYIAHFNAIGGPYQELGLTNSTITASECALWMCIQSLDISMMAGKLQQNVVREFPVVEWPKGSAQNFTFADLPVEMNPNPGVTYNISSLGLSTFRLYFSKLFTGSVNLTYAGRFPENDAVEAIWNASANLDTWTKNVAKGLTNALRYDIANPHPPSIQQLYPTPRRSIYDGTAYALGIQVRWPWLVLPVLCVAFSILCLIMVMMKTARSSVAPWKSSLLVLLFMEVDQELKQRVSWHLKDWKGVVDAIGGQQVTLTEDQEGTWRFKAA